MTIDLTVLKERPSRAVSLAVSAVLVLVWGWLRLVVFETTLLPLTYALPLLVCVWTRDRLALWGMAAIFLVFHAAKIFWILPPGAYAPADLWANAAATVINILVGAVVVDLIIALRRRLEDALRHVAGQAEELQAQAEELTQQNEELVAQAEELAQQNEELAVQGEELSSQTEELQSQAEEITALSETIERRESLLQALLETARLAGSEQTALRHVTAAAIDLFGGGDVLVAVYERTAAGVRLETAAVAGRGEIQSGVEAEDAFVDLVLRENRTASLNDAALRPDLPLVRLDGHGPFRAVLCVPVRVGGALSGAFAVYRGVAHQWTDEEFHLAEWLANQCGRVLHTLRVQADLRTADQRKNEFLAILSHELRNPLAPIAFAVNNIDDGGDRRKAMDVIRRQLRQLVRLVDDLLDATRLSSNKIQIRRTRTELAPLVRHAVDALGAEFEAARQQVIVDLPAEPIWLDADPERISQVVTNLLNNACRFTPAGGRIDVVASVAPGEARLTVRDTGVGLDPADRERVFEMFTQASGPGGGGLGIGLALVRGIVELHGGRVEALSDGRGCGSEFRMALPLAPVQVPSHAPAPSPVASPLSRRVLLVDDNIDSAEMMGALLERHGHQVCVAHDAEQALAAMHSFVPDAVVLDIGLPDISGYDLARRFRQNERTSTARLIALTGWGQEADRARAHEAGFDVHLTKPADLSHLLVALGADARR